MAEISALGGGAVRGRGRSRGQAEWKVGTLDGWTTGTSPTASTRSRRCSSCPRPIRTRCAPTGAPPRRSAPRRCRWPTWSGPDGSVELRGIGPGIEARLRELVETGEIAELAELERDLAPDMVGLGRYLGLSAKRSIELARALGVRTAEEFREAAAAGRLRSGAGYRAEDRGEAARGAGRRAPSRARARGCFCIARVSSSAGWRPRSAARWPATCAGGATPASTLRSCAPRPTPATVHRALRGSAPDRQPDRAATSAAPSG